MDRTYDMITGKPIKKKNKTPIEKAFDSVKPKGQPPTEVNEQIEQVIRQAQKDASKYFKKKKK